MLTLAFIRENKDAILKGLAVRNFKNAEETIEVHLLDFTGDLYGEKMQMEVLKRLRDEQKFSGLEELILQIKKDELTARKWIVDQH